MGTTASTKLSCNVSESVSGDRRMAMFSEHHVDSLHERLRKASGIGSIGFRIQQRRPASAHRRPPTSDMRVVVTLLDQLLLVAGVLL